MTMRVTIIKYPVYNQYGIPYALNSIQTVSTEFGESLVQTRQAIDTDGHFQSLPNDPYLRGRLFNLPTDTSIKGLPVFVIGGGCSIDGNSLSAPNTNEASGGAPVEGATFGGGTYFDFHWFHWANYFLGGVLSLVNNYADGGQELSDMIAEWDDNSENPLTDDSDVLFLIGIMTNSINPTVGNRPTATILAQYEQMISRASAAKRVVVAGEEIPVGAAWSGLARAQLGEYLSQQAERICAKYPNVLFVKFRSRLIATSNDDGLASTTFIRASDGVHLTKASGKVIGKAIAEALAGRLVVSEYDPTAVEIGPGWGVGTTGTRNAFGGAGLTTAVTGDNPFTGWDVSVTAGPGSATGVSVVVTRSATAGRLQIVIANTSASDITVELRQIANVASALANTERVFLRVGYGANGMVLTKQIDPQIQRNTTPIGTFFRTNYAEDQKAIQGVARTVKYPYASAITTVRGALVAKVGATTGTCTLDIESFSVMRIPAA